MFYSFFIVHCQVLTSPLSRNTTTHSVTLPYYRLLLTSHLQYNRTHSSSPPYHSTATLPGTNLPVAMQYNSVHSGTLSYFNFSFHCQLLTYLLSFNTITHIPLPCHIKVLLHFQVLIYFCYTTIPQSGNLQDYSIITLPGTNLSIAVRNYVINATRLV